MTPQHKTGVCTLCAVSLSTSCRCLSLTHASSCLYLQAFSLPGATLASTTAQGPASSRWVLGWQFAAGEYVQLNRDVFGDTGIQQVYMSPSLQGPSDDGGGGSSSDPSASSQMAAGSLPPSTGVIGETPQRVAVFSEYLLECVLLTGGRLHEQGCLLCCVAASWWHDAAVCACVLAQNCKPCMSSEV